MLLLVAITVLVVVALVVLQLVELLVVQVVGDHVLFYVLLVVPDIVILDVLHHALVVPEVAKVVMVVVGVHNRVRDNVLGQQKPVLVPVVERIVHLVQVHV